MAMIKRLVVVIAITVYSDANRGLCNGAITESY